MIKTRYGRSLTFILAGAVIASARMMVTTCSSSNDEERDSTAPVATARPTTAAPTVRPSDTQPSATTETVQPTAAPAGTLTAEPPPLIAETRTTGHVEGVTFVVGEGSEATVTEHLASLSLPNDAVARTSALTGEIHLDGRDSTIEINLQRLSSDNSFRDRHIRSTMFGRDPIGVFTVRGLDELPDGFADGEVCRDRSRESS